MGGGGQGGGRGTRDGRKKRREAGSLRCRAAGEKFGKASFRCLLPLNIQSKKQTQQRFLTPIKHSQRLKAKIYRREKSKTKIRTWDKKIDSITSDEIGNLSKSLTS